VTIGAILLVIGAYLLGSISSTYLVGRWAGGKDLRQYGSGTLGGSMVWEHVGRGVFFFRGSVRHRQSCAANMAGAEVGPGGTRRGSSRAGGAGGSQLVDLFAVHGRPGDGGHWWDAAELLRDSAPWLLISLLTMPLLAHLVGGPEVAAPLSGAMILLTLAKRLEANRRPLPPAAPERLKVILRRAYLDRDIASHQEWIDRRPEEDG
jgi:glycerol-3-phosphate acyltransferase PlsY